MTHFDLPVILRTVDRARRAAKVHHREGKGWKTQGYDNIRTWTAERARISTFDELSQLLTTLEAQSDAVLIRGEPVKALRIGSPHERLSNRDKHGDRATYRSHPVGRRFVCLDMDTLEAPPWFDPEVKGGLNRGVTHAISMLPGCFQAAHCHYQWSSSAGVKGWRYLKLHLWFMFDRPVCDGSLKEWAKNLDVKVDHSLFQPVQVHYTAAPIFDGGSDPLKGQRSGVVLSRCECVEVPTVLVDGAEWNRRQVKQDAVDAKERAERVEAWQDKDGATDRDVAYARGAMTNGVERVTTSAEGTRHETLMKESHMIGGFVGLGLIDRAEAEARLCAAAEAILPKSRHGEIRRTVLDGLRLGESKPTPPPAVLPERKEKEKAREKGKEKTNPVIPLVPECFDDLDFDDGAEVANLEPLDEIEWLEFDSDVHLAETVELLIRRGGGRLVHDEGELYRYKLPVWVPVTFDEQRQAAHGLDRCWLKVGVNKDQSPKLKPLRMNSSKCNAIIETLSHKRGVAAANFFRHGRRGVQFADCIVCPEGQRVVRTNSSPRHAQRVALPFDFDIAAPAPLWEEKLREWLTVEDVQDDMLFDPAEDGAAKIACLQEFCGASLFGEATRFQKAIFLTGGGDNGKSVFIKALEFAFPEGSVAHIEPQDLDGVKAEYYVAQMVGKLFNLAADIPSTEIISSSALKKVITGDTLQGRHPYGRPFSMEPKAGWICSANELPPTRDFSLGFWRRFLLIDFPNVFGPERKDKHLADKLKEERAGIISWCLRGYERLLINGEYTRPPSIDWALGEWRRDADPVAAWIQDNVQDATESSVFATSADLYKDFMAWREKSGLPAKFSIHRFSKRLAMLGYRKTKRSAGVFWPVRISGTLPI